MLRNRWRRNLNSTPRETIPNLVSATGTVNIYSFAGSTDVVADVVGNYTN